MQVEVEEMPSVTQNTQNYQLEIRYGVYKVLYTKVPKWYRNFDENVSFYLQAEAKVLNFVKKRYVSDLKYWPKSGLTNSSCLSPVQGG